MVLKELGSPPDPFFFLFFNDSPSIARDFCDKNFDDRVHLGAFLRFPPVYFPVCVSAFANIVSLPLSVS